MQKKTLFITVILLFVFDLIFVFLHFNNYIVNLFKETGLFMPLLINIFILMFIAIKLKKWWLLILPSILCFLLGIYIFLVILLNSLVSWQYDNIHSPMRTETLMIKHRSATLGETTFFYEFYKTSFMGLIIKKLDGTDMEIMVRDSSREKGDLELLNIQSPTWVNETTVILHTLNGDKTIMIE